MTKKRKTARFELTKDDFVEGASSKKRKPMTEDEARRIMAQSEESWRKLPFETLDWYEQIYRDGHRMALMGAINTCAKNNLPLPKWAADSIRREYNEMIDGQKRSWDEVFGVPYPGKHRAKVVARRELMSIVHLRIETLRELEFERIGDLLFGRVARELVREGYAKKLSAGQVNKLWYLGKRVFGD